MTSHPSRHCGCAAYTPFEQELVNAMNDFVNSADAPQIDTAAIARGARRKRTTAVAGIAAALLLAGAGTALATSGSHHAQPASSATHKKPARTADKNLTTVQYGEIPIQVGGFNLDMAEAELGAKAGLKIAVVKASPEGCKPTSILAVSPHAPTVVHKGDTVTLTVCAR
jgi:hypothetical protein